MDFCDKMQAKGSVLVKAKAFGSRPTISGCQLENPLRPSRSWLPHQSTCLQPGTYHAWLHPNMWSWNSSIGVIFTSKISFKISSPLTTSRRLTCIHAKLFPTVKRRTCIHDLRHYSRNSYSATLADMPFSQSPAGHAWETPDKRHCKQWSSPLFLWIFCLIPLSNTCSFVRPARNVNRETFLHCQEGFCVGKFGLVVDNRPLHKHFRWSRLCYKRQALLKI